MWINVMLNANIKNNLLMCFLLPEIPEPRIPTPPPSPLHSCFSSRPCSTFWAKKKKPLWFFYWSLMWNALSDVRATKLSVSLYRLWQRKKERKKKPPRKESRSTFHSIGASIPIGWCKDKIRMSSDFISETSTHVLWRFHPDGIIISYL